MNPETQTEGQEKAAPTEQPPSSAPQTGQHRRRGRGRSRFKRGNRDDRPPRRDQSQANAADDHRHQPDHPGGHGHPKPHGTIGKAIEQVEGVRVELQRALEDIEEVLRTLEQVDREKTASEEEIEALRESLRLLQREPGQGRHSRPVPQPRRAPTENSAVPAVEEDAEEED
jgi:plasmid stabilization system protein ParE